MVLAFVTAALASGFAAAGLTALLVWVTTVLTGSPDPWSLAPWLVSAAAVLVALGTFIAERIAYRRTMSRMRATGEPWAYRGER
jgi:hypothetical protein